MSDVRWEDPPGKSDRGGAPGTHENNAFRAELIANPGIWAIYREAPSDHDGVLRNTGSVIRGAGYGWRNYRWETALRRVDGTTKLYVRCLGPVGGAS